MYCSENNLTEKKSHINCTSNFPNFFMKKLFLVYSLIKNGRTVQGRRYEKEVTCGNVWKNNRGI
jgi:hypothetical protein